MRTGNQHLEDPNTAANCSADAMHDPVLESAIGTYRDSIHAWSEAAYQRPRSIASPRRSTRRQAVAWALGSAMMVGILGTGIHEQHRHQQEVARLSAQRSLERERQLAAQKAKETEDLLAQVDKDVSREVPSAMDPLAQLMTDGDGK